MLEIRNYNENGDLIDVLLLLEDDDETFIRNIVSWKLFKNLILGGILNV